jgi:tRNA(fMet)-specific endonuclease VapC
MARGFLMYMLDTNICIYIKKQKPSQVLEKFSHIPLDQLCLSVITFSELLYGAMKSQQVEQNLVYLQQLKAKLKVLPFDAEAAEIYGKIRTYLEKQGLPIGSNDLLIAAHAIRTRSVLVTNNTREFSRIPELKLENWAVY